MSTTFMFLFYAVVILCGSLIIQTNADCDFLTTPPVDGWLGTCGVGGNPANVSATSLADESSCSFNCTSGYILVGDPRFCNGTDLMGDDQTCVLGCPPLVDAPLYGDVGTCGDIIMDTRSCDFNCEAYYGLDGPSRVCTCDPVTLVCTLSGYDQTCDYEYDYGDFDQSKQGVIGASVGFVALAIVLGLVYLIKRRFFSSYTQVHTN